MSVVSAFAHMQVMDMLEYRIRCSDSAVFLIALVGASMQ